MSVLYAIYDPPTSDLPFLAVAIEGRVVSAVPFPTREQAENLIEESVRIDGADPKTFAQGAAGELECSGACAGHFNRSSTGK